MSVLLNVVPVPAAHCGCEGWCPMFPKDSKPRSAPLRSAWTLGSELISIFSLISAEGTLITAGISAEQLRPGRMWRLQNNPVFTTRRIVKDPPSALIWSQASVSQCLSPASSPSSCSALHSKGFYNDQLTALPHPNPPHTHLKGAACSSLMSKFPQISKHRCSHSVSSLQVGEVPRLPPWK